LIAAGNRIITLKNYRELGVRNGTLGVVRDLDEAGRVLVDMGGREVTLDLKKYRQVDHAYAVTIHKNQGATVEHSMMFALVRPVADESRLFSGMCHGSWNWF